MFFFFFLCEKRVEKSGNFLWANNQPFYIDVVQVGWGHWYMSVLTALRSSTLTDPAIGCQEYHKNPWKKLSLWNVFVSGVVLFCDKGVEKGRKNLGIIKMMGLLQGKFWKQHWKVRIPDFCFVGVVQSHFNPQEVTNMVTVPIIFQIDNVKGP